MKILLFTHKSDIDGMGSVVLAKLCFSKVDYVLCESFNLQEQIAKFCDNGMIYEYDIIFVTDLFLEEPMLSQIASDNKLKNKFLVFDHHESALKENLDKYSFVTIKISDNNGLCSGTSLFYDYLISTKKLSQKNQSIYEFSELTRKYDTWEWQTLYHEEMPHELTLLFDAIGSEGYIELMYQKLQDKNIQSFRFNELETILIKNKINQVQEKLINYAKKVCYRQVFGLKAGIVFIAYEFRNDLAEYLRQNKFDIDFVMLISLDNEMISYRSIKDNVNVRLIAEKMGGKGHDKTAGRPISKEEITKIIDILTKKEMPSSISIEE